MEEKASGLVVRLHPLTETSLIVHWLTADQGRLATVAKGARRPQSPFRGKLDLFFLNDFSFARSRRSELHTLREAVVLDPHLALRQDFGWLQQAAYAAALIAQATETETPLPGIFDLLLGCLRHLPRQPKHPRAILAFEMKLLAGLGLEPPLASTRLSPGAGALLERLRDWDWPDLARLQISPPQAAELRAFLAAHLQACFGKILATRAPALVPA